MQALSDLSRERNEFRNWQTYMAEMAWASARANYKEFPFPSYTELTKKPQAVKDDRSAEEIRAGIVARLRKGVKYDDTV